MRAFATIAALALVLLPWSASRALAHEEHHHHDASEEATSSDALLAHYEAIRQLLIADTADGAAGHAKELAEVATALSGESDAAHVGVAPDELAAARALLPEIAAAATRLAEAHGLEATREAFGALSQPLVRYRELLHGDVPEVVYCPMAKKSWLQPEGPIGNPYYGTSMLRCGKVVSK